MQGRYKLPESNTVSTVKYEHLAGLGSVGSATASPLGFTVSKFRLIEFIPILETEYFYENKKSISSSSLR